MFHFCFLRAAGQSLQLTIFFPLKMQINISSTRSHVHGKLASATQIARNVSKSYAFLSHSVLIACERMPVYLALLVWRRNYKEITFMPLHPCYIKTIIHRTHFYMISHHEA
jgi:hypothetical protein